MKALAKMHNRYVNEDVRGTARDSRAVENNHFEHCDFVPSSFCAVQTRHYIVDGGDFSDALFNAAVQQQNVCKAPFVAGTMMGSAFVAMP